jgi:hypothetical protein
MTLPAGQSPARTRLARLAIGWVFFANGAALGSWVPQIPDAKHALGLTDGLLGLALLGLAAGSLVGLPLSGVLTARFGSRKTTTAAILAMLLATPLPILAPGPPLFAIALGLLGMANGAVDVAMNTQAIAVQDRYGRAIMSGFHGLFSIGGLADALPPEIYAYRAGRNAQQAVVDVEELLFRGHPDVVDADLADFFGDACPRRRLRAACVLDHIAPAPGCRWHRPQLRHLRGRGYARHFALTDWQRNGRAKDVVGIVMPLGGDEPVCNGTIAFCHTVRVVSGQEVRISTRMRHRSEGSTSGSSPLAMPLLLFFVRPIDEGGEDLDQHVVTAQAEGRRLCRYARGGASELVREDGAAGRGGVLHRLDKDIDTGAVERGKPARLHENRLSIGEIRIKQGQ